MHKRLAILECIWPWNQALPKAEKSGSIDTFFALDFIDNYIIIPNL